MGHKILVELDQESELELRRMAEELDDSISHAAELILEPELKKIKAYRKNPKSQHEWQYDEDCGNVLCRCPNCGGRLIIGLYQYGNPYHYCPYCGKDLAEGKITAKRKKVYKLEQEESGYAKCH